MPCDSQKLYLKMFCNFINGILAFPHIFLLTSEVCPSGSLPSSIPRSPSLFHLQVVTHLGATKSKSVRIKHVEEFTPQARVFEIPTPPIRIKSFRRVAYSRLDELSHVHAFRRLTQRVLTLHFLVKSLICSFLVRFHV